MYLAGFMHVHLEMVKCGPPMRCAGVVNRSESEKRVVVGGRSVANRRADRDAGSARGVGASSDGGRLGRARRADEPISSASHEASR